MASLTQIKGMMLEEVMLFLLQRSGYVTVDGPGRDPTLRAGKSGLEVRGRGEHHQIDGVADFMIQQPFGYPARLLLEAKFRGAPTGIETVRNAVGVLKDVSEHFIAPVSHQDLVAKRYQYQMAIASASRFTAIAERYAFTQGIDLIPLNNSAFFRGMIDAIDRIDPALGSVRPSELRRQFRDALVNRGTHLGSGIPEVVEECFNVGSAFMAVTSSGQRLFLVPAPRVRVQEFPDEIRVRVQWNDQGWYLYDVHDEPLFSFDLPEAIARAYASGGSLRPEVAVELKSEHLDRITLYSVTDGRVRVHRLVLDIEWMDRLRRSVT